MRTLLYLACLALVLLVRLGVRMARNASAGQPWLAPPLHDSWLTRLLPAWLRNANVLSARYLGRREPVTFLSFLPSLILFLLVIVLAVTQVAFDRVVEPDLLPFVYRARPIIRIVQVAAVGLFEIFLLFRVLRLRFNLFSTLSIMGLFIGTAAMVTVVSVMSGFEKDLRTKIVGMHAHVVLDREEGPFEDYQKVAAQVRADRDVVGASPYLSDEVVIASPSSSSAVVLKGIDLASVNTTSELGTKLDVGDLSLLGDPEKLRDFRLPARVLPGIDDPPGAEAKGFDEGGAGKQHYAPPGSVTNPPTDPATPRRALPGIFIGRELARSLRVYIGDEVDLVSPQGGIGPTGAIPKSKPFRIAGEFYTGMLEYDSKYAIVALPVAQKFTERGDEVTAIEIKVKDSDATEAVMARLRPVVGSTYSIRDWKELNRGLFAALKLEKILMFVALSFIILVAAFSIIANGMVTVFEKRREIAMLRAMGIETRTILVVFLQLGARIGVVGIVLGLLEGLGTALALRKWGFDLLGGSRDVYYLTQLPVEINGGEIAAIAAMSLLLVLLATLYPAVLGARQQPADGIRR